MRRFIVFTTAACLALAALVACSPKPSSPPSAAPLPSGEPVSTMEPTGVDDPDALGEELVRRWLDMLHGLDSDMTAIEDFLAPNFQIQRDDGSRANKEEYLAEPATVHAYEIRDLIGAVATDAGAATLTVTFELEVEVTINGKHHATLAPRIATFTWTGDRWTLLSYANFGTLPNDAPEP